MRNPLKESRATSRRFFLEDSFAALLAVAGVSGCSRSREAARKKTPDVEELMDAAQKAIKVLQEDKQSLAALHSDLAKAIPSIQKSGFSAGQARNMIRQYFTPVANSRLLSAMPDNVCTSVLAACLMDLLIEKSLHAGFRVTQLSTHSMRGKSLSINLAPKYSERHPGGHLVRNSKIRTRHLLFKNTLANASQLIAQVPPVPPGPLPPIPPVPDFPPPAGFTQDQWRLILDEVDDFLQWIWSRTDRQVHNRIWEAFWRAQQAVTDARRQGVLVFGRLSNSLVTLARHLHRAGAQQVSRDAFLRITARLSHLFRSTGGAAGGFGTMLGGGAVATAAVGEAVATAVAVVVEFIIVLVIIALWAYLWIKIGQWLWNQEIPGGEGETYIEFYGDLAYRYLFFNNCDNLLAVVQRADARFRRLEQSGASGMDLKAPAAVGVAAIARYLTNCETAIRPTLDQRLERYGEVLVQ